MNKKLIPWSIAPNPGGFLFGLDVAIISGTEQNFQQLWRAGVPGRGHEIKGVFLENRDIRPGY